jgi:hypothetical protein
MKEAADWIETYWAYWEESFDRLDVSLKTIATPSSKGKANGQRSKR